MLRRQCPAVGGLQAKAVLVHQLAQRAQRLAQAAGRLAIRDGGLKGKGCLSHRRLR